LTPENVGPRGGDLASRRFALIVSATLTVLALPPLSVADGVFRILGLAVALSGALLLMAGMVFLQKAHYAGLMLIPLSCGMVALVHLGSRLGAVVLGIFFCGIMLTNLITRRCGLNRLLGIDSCA